MRKTLVVLGLLAGIFAFVLAEGWAAQLLTKSVKLPFRLNSPMRLSPDGKKVLRMRRLKKRGYGYVLHDIATKKDTPLCPSPGLADDMFFFSFGAGMWAPNGKSFVVIKRRSMKLGGSFGPTTIARCDLSGKEIPLAVGKGSSSGGVFGPKGTLFFVRNLGTKNKAKGQLCQLLPKGHKPTGCISLPGRPIGISASPDRTALAGLVGSKEGVRMWAYQIKTKKRYLSPAFKTNDYTWKPLAHWSLDSRSLFVNGDKQSHSKRRFSVFHYRPFAKKDVFRELLKGQRYNTLGELAPGVLLVFQRRPMVPRRFSLATGKFLANLKKGHPAAGVIAVLDKKGNRQLVINNKRGVLILE